MKTMRYQGFTFKLNKKTIKTLKEKKEKSGLTWNLFFYQLILKVYGDETLPKLWKK